MPLKVAGLELDDVKDVETVLKAIEVLRAEVANLTERAEELLREQKRIAETFRAFSDLPELSRQLEELKQSLPSEAVAQEVAQAREQISLIRKEAQSLMVKTTEDSLKIWESYRHTISEALDKLLDTAEKRARRVQKLMYRFSFLPLLASALAGIIFFVAVIFASIHFFKPKVIIRGERTYIVMESPISLSARAE